jgi:hypothetical protein
VLGFREKVVVKRNRVDDVALPFVGVPNQGEELR